MSDAAGFWAVLLDVLEVAFVVALPVVALELGTLVLHRAAPMDYFRIPLVRTLPKLLGLTLGAWLLYMRYDWRFFDLHRLFAPESPWNLTLSQFLVERADPFLYGPWLLLGYLASNPIDPAFDLLALAVGVLAAASAAVPFLFWPRPIARRAALCSLGIGLLAAYVTAYAVCLLLWSLFLLNFWTFAVIGVLFQYYRHRA